MFTSGTVDYLTVTAKHGSQEYAALGAVYDAIRHDDDYKGLDEKPARALGYVGSKIGTMFFGSNQDGAMFRASAELAQVAAAMLAWLPGNHHVTRIDFQLTWGYEYDQPKLAETIAADVRQAQARQKVINPPAVRLISSFGKGDTATIGSRSSEVFIRVYDKTREQKLNEGPWMWRYEVELKGERALQAIKLWCHRSGDNAVVFEVVDSFCQRWSIPVPWSERSSLSWPEIGRPLADAERKLQWLESHVRSSVQYLINKGHTQLVLEALGLDEVAARV